MFHIGAPDTCCDETRHVPSRTDACSVACSPHVRRPGPEPQAQAGDLRDSRRRVPIRVPRASDHLLEQQTGPTPSHPLSETALSDPDLSDTERRKYVASATAPYIGLPEAVRSLEVPASWGAVPSARHLDAPGLRTAALNADVGPRIVSRGGMALAPALILEWVKTPSSGQARAQRTVLSHMSGSSGRIEHGAGGLWSKASGTKPRLRSRGLEEGQPSRRARRVAPPATGTPITPSPSNEMTAECTARQRHSAPFDHRALTAVLARRAPARWHRPALRQRIGGARSCGNAHHTRLTGDRRGLQAPPARRWSSDLGTRGLVQGRTACHDPALPDLGRVEAGVPGLGLQSDPVTSADPAEALRLQHVGRLPRWAERGLRSCSPGGALWPQDPPLLIGRDGTSSSACRRPHAPRVRKECRCPASTSLR